MTSPATLLWLALTVYYEARGEAVVGQKAVVKVILNRAKAKGWEVQDVVKAKKQFSCYNDGLTSALLHIKEIPVFIAIWQTVQEAAAEWDKGDRLSGATHYYELHGVSTDSGKLTGKPPYWAASMTPCVKIGRHQFLREG